MAGKLVFSVIIPTYNRPSSLQACLKALARQNYDYSKFEVLVVDDGSSTPVADAALAEFSGPPVTLIRNFRNEGPAAARNKGSEYARGQYLAFTDDDCLPAPGWLSELHSALAIHPSAAVGGSVACGGKDLVSIASHSILETAYRYYNGAAASPRFFASLNLALPAKEYRELGGFNPEFRTSEDREFCARWLRLGYQLAFAPQAIVVHQPNPGLRHFLRQHFGYGRGSYRYRMLQAKISGGFFQLEPARFYRQLLCPPGLRNAPLRTVAVSFFAALSQFASLLGFLSEHRNAKRALK